MDRKLKLAPPHSRLRTAVAATLVLACATLGTAYPRWSYALYEMGHYSEAAQSVAAANAWQQAADRSAQLAAQCLDQRVSLCAERAELSARHAFNLAEEYLAIATGPPDSDYTRVNAPQVDLTPLAVKPGTSRAFNSAWADLFANEARTTALLNAFVEANQRSRGALLARATGWPQTQGQLAALYASELATLTAAHPGLAAHAVAAWREEALPTVADGAGIGYPDLLAASDLDQASLDFSVAMRNAAAANIARVGLLVRSRMLPRPGSDAPELAKVALLGTATIDARDINPATLRFGPGLAHAGRRVHIEDVDGDGRPDVVLEFAANDAGLECGDTALTVLGSTFAGRAIGGLAYARTAGCRG